MSGLPTGSVYKYKVKSRYSGYKVEKADPFAFTCEAPPKTASVVWDLTYAWGDKEWMSVRSEVRPARVADLNL